MPGSARRYAVDFDRDGRIDLWHSDDDAIGSVANYLARHDWLRGQPIWSPASIAASQRDAALAKLDGGMSERRPLAAWNADGVAAEHLPDPLAAEPVGLLALELAPDATGEPLGLWIAFPNFYVITRQQEPVVRGRGHVAGGSVTQRVRRHVIVQRGLALKSRRRVLLSAFRSAARDQCERPRRHRQGSLVRKTRDCSGACSATQLRAQLGDDGFRADRGHTADGDRFRRATGAEADAHRRALTGLLNPLPIAQALEVVRAFIVSRISPTLPRTSIGIRRRRGSARSPDRRRGGDIEEALKRLAHGGVVAQGPALARRGTRKSVLTAHPTEVQRKSILDVEREIARLLTWRDRTTLTPDEAEEFAFRLHTSVLELWRRRCRVCRGCR
jgi:hypothetical protein